MLFSIENVDYALISKIYEFGNIIFIFLIRNYIIFFFSLESDLHQVGYGQYFSLIAVYGGRILILQFLK
jgi:hypothetical protein